MNWKKNGKLHSMMLKRPGRGNLRSLFNPVTTVTTLILIIGLVLTGAIVLLLGRKPAPNPGLLPVVTKVAAATRTPKPTQPPVLPSETPTSGFFLPEGVIGIGAYVQVTGTEGAGLRMRIEPGLNGVISFSAMDCEVFLVIDGPVDADGYTWWHLEAPYDKTRNGWSASNYLTPIEEEE